jgi:hypothetical protein
VLDSKEAGTAVRPSVSIVVLLYYRRSEPSVRQGKRYDAMGGPTLVERDSRDELRESRAIK